MPLLCETCHAFCSMVEGAGDFVKLSLVDTVTENGTLHDAVADQFHSFKLCKGSSTDGSARPTLWQHVHRFLYLRFVKTYRFPYETLHATADKAYAEIVKPTGQLQIHIDMGGNVS